MPYFKDFLQTKLSNSQKPKRTIIKYAIATIACSHKIRQKVRVREKLMSQEDLQCKVNLIHEFLLRNNLSQTAELLKKQALIADKQNVQEYIFTIKNSENLHQQQKRHKIKTELEKRYLKEVSQNNYESALKILNQKMPEYFVQSDIDRFAESLIPSFADTQANQKSECLMNGMMESYFIKNSFEDAKLPNSRSKIYDSNQQIWFVKYGGQYIIAIDQQRKGMIFSKDLTLLYEKQNLHQGMVSNVKWRNPLQFATCSESGEIKIWNYKFEQLYSFKYHKKQINAFTFCTFLDKQFIVSGGHDKFIVFNNITSINDHIQTKIKLKQVLVRDIRYYKKRNQLIFLNQNKKQKSTIKFYNPDSMKWVGEIKSNQLFFEMELSLTDDILHIITQSGQIFSYSLTTYEKVGVFIGTNSKNFVIRMQKGGYMNQFLATGSQSGQILIFNQRKVQAIKRLKAIQKTVVNSVTWIDSTNIVCGCDNGNLELWVYEKQNKLQ